MLDSSESHEASGGWRRKEERVLIESILLGYNSLIMQSLIKKLAFTVHSFH
jgi:hypothetical protein